MIKTKTAKEKAQELVDKYKVYSYGITEKNIIDCAKRCALICVDEILKEIERIDDGQTFIPYKYWQEIKQEIEKL